MILRWGEDTPIENGTRCPCCNNPCFFGRSLMPDINTDYVPGSVEAGVGHPPDAAAIHRYAVQCFTCRFSLTVGIPHGTDDLCKESAFKAMEVLAWLQSKLPSL